jgi:hypothetical protein
VYVAGYSIRRILTLNSERDLLRFRVSVKIVCALTAYEGLFDDRDSDCHRRNEQEDVHGKSEWKEWSALAT